MLQKINFRKVCYIFLLLISAHFISAGRLSGDAIYIFQDAFEFSKDWDIKSLDNVLPRRYAVFSLIFLPTKFILLITPDVYNKELFYIIPGIISNLTTCVWFLTIILTCKLIDPNSSFLTKTFTVSFFFCTPLIFLSNEVVQENFIIFFIALYLYYQKFYSRYSKVIMNISLFFIIFLKFYFVPLIVFLIYRSNRYKIVEKFYIFTILTISTAIILFLPSILFDVRSSSNTIDIVYNLNYFFSNIYLYFFSLNYGFFLNYHIFSILFLIFLIKKNKIDLLAINIFYISFFSLLPFWHGDMAGSRYMTPINFINLCFLLEYINKSNFINTIKHKLSLLLLTIWCFSFNNINYDMASLNRYYDGVSYSKINNTSYFRKDLFAYKNFPYYELELHPFYFGTKVGFYKIYNDSPIISFYENKINLEKKNIYPRAFYSVINYFHKNSNLIKKTHENYISKFINYENLKKLIEVMLFLSLFWTFTTPFIILSFVNRF